MNQEAGKRLDRKIINVRFTPNTKKSIIRN